MSEAKSLPSEGSWTHAWWQKSSLGAIFFSGGSIL
jgi:hypothetical protein